MSSPYGPVNSHALLPPGYKCTAYWYALHRGLPVSPVYLLELGLRAARAARWLGLEQSPVCETGPDGIQRWVHQWPEDTWTGAADSIARAPRNEAGLDVVAGVPLYQQPPPRPGPYRDPSCDRCNYDTHRCRGCGEPLPHGTETCARCLAPYARPDSPHPMVHDVLALDRRYRHSGDPAWESADGDPEGYGDPVPAPSGEPRMTAWQYAGRSGTLTGDSDDPDYVSALDRYAAWVAARRGLPQVQAAVGAGYLVNTWPETLWSEVTDAMAQRGAESGDWHLDDLELDALAGGHWQHRPSAAQFLAPGYDDGSLGTGFWSYPPPPEGTQAYADWTAMADQLSRQDAREFRDILYEERDAGWGEGIAPRDGDDIRPYA